MDIQKEYTNAIQNRQYDQLFGILIKNLLTHFDYQTISDLGSYLCDCAQDELKVTLNEEERTKLGMHLLECSYYTHPDTANAFALQDVCFKMGNFSTVTRMLETARHLKNSCVLNNIACALYQSGRLQEAMALQQEVVKLDNKALLFAYNLLLYRLFSGLPVHADRQSAEILNMLLDDDVFDYESAVVLAICLDARDFVKQHLDFLFKTFACSAQTKEIINAYLAQHKMPDLPALFTILQPKTTIGNGFYLTMDERR